MEITRFPHLYPSRKPVQLEESISTRNLSATATECCERRQAYLAWASVLKAYTGRDNLSFYSDDSVISIDSKTWLYEEVQWGEVRRAAEVNGQTALYLNRPTERQSTSLELYLDTAKSIVTLSHRGWIPTEHVDALLEHFAIALAWTCSHDDGYVPAEHFACLPSSATNPRPGLRHGFDLLHKLVPAISSQNAVEFDTLDNGCESLSYAQLHDASHNLAVAIAVELRHCSCSMQPVIALMIPQSLELYVAQLAVLKTGSAFCSISLDSPVDRASFIISDIAAPLILKTSYTPLRIALQGTKVLNVDAVMSNVSSASASSSVFEVTSSDVAYVMYTSGSTGMPKGVPVCHRAVTQSLLAHDRHIPKFSRFLQFAAPTFDVSLFEIFFTFYRGATLIGCERRKLLDDLAGAINSLNVDAVELTPAVAGSLLKTRKTVPCLRLLLTIGEMLTQSVIHEFGGDEHQEGILWAMYGPTEATIHCTIMPQMISSSIVGNIGFPLDTVSAFIASPALPASPGIVEILPVGFVGELVIGGHQLADGYLNREQQTKESFIDTQHFGQLYRTGDMARKLPDGTLECLGRIATGQVKLRGQRIEVGEVENTALRVSGCSAAVVSVIANALVMFCCVDDSVHRRVIDDVLCQWLPEYMRPSDVVLMKKFPHSQSGKVDKKALEREYDRRRETGSLAELQEEYEEARRLIDTIKCMTKQDVAPCTSLASLGIDSLSAISLASRLRVAGHSITTVDIVKSDTIRDLLILSRAQESAGELYSDTPDVIDHDHIHTAVNDNPLLQDCWHHVEAVQPCTPVQLGLLFESLRRPGAYWNRVELSLPCNVVSSIVTAGLIELAAQNKILRSGFLYTSSSEYPFVQIIWTLKTFKERLIASDLALGNGHAHDNFLRPLSFALDRNDEQARLTLQVHHAIYDGWSLDLIAADLSSWIRTSRMPSRPQFQLVQSYNAQIDRSKSYDYWTRHLLGCKLAKIAEHDHVDKANSEQASFETHVLEGSAFALSDLRHAAASIHVSPQCYFQAALLCFIARFAHEADVMISVVTSGRTIPVAGVEDIIGPCMSTLPMRINVAHALVVRDLLANVHHRNRLIVEHGMVTLRDLVKLADLPIGRSITEGLFIWQETVPREDDAGDTVVSVLAEPDQTEFGFTLEVRPSGEHVTSRLTYNKHTMPSFNADSILHGVNDLVRVFVQQPNLAVEQLQLGGSWATILDQSLKKPDRILLQSGTIEDDNTFRTETEKLLQEIISKELHLVPQEIKVSAPLSHYGVDSLRVIAISRALRDTGCTSCSIEMILKHQTIAAIAKVLDSTSDRDSDSDSATKSILIDNFLPLSASDSINEIFASRNVGPVRLLPCTPLQEAMLAASIHEPETYCEVLEFKILGSAENLVQCWNTALSRHQIFRTVFVSSSNVHFPFIQVVLPQVPNENKVEFSNEPPSTLETMKGLRDQLKPLHRSFLIESESDTILKLVCHHAIFDATAMQQFFRDVEALFHGRVLAPSAGPDEFLNSSLLQRSDEAVRYWCQQLDGFSPKILRSTSKGRQQMIKHDLQLNASAIQQATRHLQSSNLAIFQAVVATLLSQLCDSQDVCFGNVVSGRTLDIAGLDRLVFPTFNTNPVRVDLTEYHDNNTLVQHLYRTSVDALSYQLVPLRAIQQQMCHTENGLFSALLLVQHAQYAADITIWQIVSDSGNMDLPLVFEVIPVMSSDNYQLYFHFDSTIVNLDEAKQICQLFDYLVYNIIRYPSTPVREVTAGSNIAYPNFASRLYQSKAPWGLISALHDTPERPLRNAEKYLFDILSSFTNVDVCNIRLDSTIHHLGIDSIRSIQLAAILSRELDAKISSADILEHSKVAELARWLDSRRHCNSGVFLNHDWFEFDAEVGDRVIEFLRTARTDIDHTIHKARPCTPSQCAMVSQSVQAPGRYVNSMTYSLRLAHYNDNLSQIMDHWVFRNEILRTTIVPIVSSLAEMTMVTYARNPPQLFTIVTDRAKLDVVDVSDMSILSPQPPWRAFVAYEGGILTVRLLMLHSLFDARSLVILLQDLHSLLASNTAQIANQDFDPVLTQLIHNRSYAKEELHNHREFWQSIAPEATPVAFPCLSPLCEIGGKGVLEQRSTQSLETFEAGLARNGWTVQAAAQATWARLLSSYTGEANVCFGVVLLGRDVLDNAMDVAFPCMTTVPCLATVTYDSDKDLQNMMMFNSRVRRHQFCTPKDIAAWLNCSKSPLFDTILAIQRPLSSRDAETWTLVAEEATDEFVVSLELVLSDAGPFIIRVTYDKGMLPTQQAEMMIRQFEFLLVDCAGLRSEPVSMDRNMLSVLAPQQIALSSPVSALHQFIEVYTARMPDTKALEFVYRAGSDAIQSTVYSYRQLNQESNAIAARLQHLGVQPRNFVAICFDKCAEASFAIIGVLKAGCAYVALDPKAPMNRKQYILQDSGARIVLTTEDLVEEFSFLHEKPDLNDVQILDVASNNGYGSLFVPISVTGSDPCYCLYTSGTTGKPKGCIITHENAVQAMRAFSKQFAGRWNTASKWLQFASFHFDVSVLEQFWPWSEGLSVVSAPRDVMLEDLAAFIQRLEVTHLDLTPSLATLLHPEDVPSLHSGVFITGGENLRQDILDVWGPYEVIFNAYGPTECTIGVSMFPGVPENGRPANIGWLFHNAGCYVLEPGTARLILRGGVGELCISGKLVGNGYLNNSSLTKAKFPMLEAFGEKVYRTGDLVRLLHDNSIQFVGRSDDQVKLRGQRLEIGEINHIIKAVAEVQQVTTLVFKHPQQGKDHLASFIVASAAAKGSIEDLRIDQAHVTLIAEIVEHCQLHLQPYMVPTYIIPVNKLLLTPNNKIDHASLRQFLEDEAFTEIQNLMSTAKHTRSKLTQKEDDIAVILVEHCAIEKTRILPQSNLFELGLDSISIVSLAARLKKLGFVNSTPLSLMQAPSIAALAKVLQMGNDSHDKRKVSFVFKQKIKALYLRYVYHVSQNFGLAGVNIKAILPSTPMQEAMVVTFQTEQNHDYFLSFDLHLSNKVDLARLQAAWTRVYNALDILRTCFVAIGGEILQMIVDNGTLPWEVSRVPPSSLQEQKESAGQRWLDCNRPQISRPFNLTLFHTDSHVILCLMIFHGLYDGKSLSLLLQAVRQAYDSDAELDVAPQFAHVLPHGPLQQFSGRDYWKMRLSKAHAEIPRLYSDHQHRSCVVTRRVINVSLLDAVRKQLNVPHQAILQACWSLTLAEHCKGLPIVGIVTAGRALDYPGVAAVIGPMLNTVLFQPPIHEGQTWKQFIKSCHSLNVSSIPHQHDALRSVLKAVGKHASTVPDNLFIFEVQDDKDVTSQHNDLWDLGESSPLALCPWTFEAILLGQSLHLTLVSQHEYGELALLEQTLNRLEHYLQIVFTNFNEGLDVTAIATLLRQAKHETSGTHSLVNGVTEYIWSAEATVLRLQIAKLAQIHESQIHPSQSIFEVGLDSIDVVALASRMSKMGLLISMSTIMQHPVISDLADRIAKVTDSSTELSDGSRADLRPIVRRDLIDIDIHDTNIETILPATPLQETMISRMSATDYVQYYNHDVLELAPSVDGHRLKQSWLKAINILKILRTAFVEINDPSLEYTYAQVVYRAASKSVCHVVSSSSSPMEHIIEKHMQEARVRGIARPLLQLTMRENEHPRLLIISLPHALYDGWSIQLLHHSIKQIYYGQEIKPTSNHAVLQDILARDTHEAQLFWQNYLNGCLPTRIGLRTLSSNSIVHHHEMSSRITVDKLRSFCKRNGITVHCLSQTCWSLVLSSLVQCLDIVFGVVLSCRDDEDSHNAQFPMMNTIAFRTILHGCMRDMLHDTQRYLNDARRFQHYPLRKAQKAAGHNGELFNTLFLHQARPHVQQALLPDLYHSIHEESSVEYPLCLESEISGDKFNWRCAVNSVIMSKDAARSMLQQLDLVLESVVADVDAQVVSLVGDEVQVARLPPFHLIGPTVYAMEKSDTNGHTSSSMDLTDFEKIVIRTLLQFVDLPEAEILLSDSIYHYGLDSITAIKFCNALKKQGLHLGLSDLLQCPTVSGIASAVQPMNQEDARSKAGSSTAVSEWMQPQCVAHAAHQLQRASNTIIDIRPATAGQCYFLRVWNNSGGRLFYSQFEYVINGPTSLQNVQTAWNKVIANNEILRTSFVSSQDASGTILQVVLLDGHNSKHAPSQRLGIDQPLHSVLVTQVGDNEWKFCLTIHHALYDGVSLDALILQLQHQLDNSQKSALAGLRKDFVSRSELKSTEPHDAKEFWTKYLPSRLNAMGSQVAPKSSAVFKRTELYRAACLLDVHHILQYSRKIGVSTAALLLTGFAMSKHRRQECSNGNTDMVIGLYIANRTELSTGTTWSTIPTVNIVPLRITLRKHDTIAMVAQQVQQDLNLAQQSPYCETSLAQIREWTGVTIDTTINIVHLPEQETPLQASGPITIREVKPDHGPSDGQVIENDAAFFELPVELDLSSNRDAYRMTIDIEMAVRNGGLDVGVFAPASDLTLEEARDLLSRFKQILQSIEA